MNILTFDIEEWYVYGLYPKGGKAYFVPILDRYLKNILDLLDKYEAKATFFCLGELAFNYPEVVKLIAERGHDIGCHSDKHKLITQMNTDVFRLDTIEALDKIAQVTGQKVISYRAPAFSITEDNKWAFEILAESGIKYDSSVFPANRSFGGFPSFQNYYPSIVKYNDIEIKEFPINIVNFLGKKIAFSGGGYFRLFPYFLLQKFTEASNYNMTYFHIRDFDKEQKVVLSFRYFKSYYGIKNAFSKFERYLNDFKFISIEQANKEMNWNQVDHIEL
ncbi:polysaccharide deacetylase [Bacteroidia bacterium]|nr:polysaccharide deacetylase [Bacteroidia bacterium]